MSTIIYDAEDMEVATTRLNGREGAIQLFVDEEAREDDDEMVTFENLKVLDQFLDRLVELRNALS